MDPLTRGGLAASGFQGFVPFHGIDLEVVPTGAGVYVVLRESPDPPTFLAVNPAGWFKGKDPTAPVSDLEAAWPTGAHCVYIGKASAGKRGDRGLRQRVKEFRQYGDGHPVGHQGGRRIWQLADADQFVLGWRETGDPEELEGELIRGFVVEHGRRPLGNRNSGRC